MVATEKKTPKWGTEFQKKCMVQSSKRGEELPKVVASYLLKQTKSFISCKCSQVDYKT